MQQSITVLSENHAARNVRLFCKTPACGMPHAVVTALTGKGSRQRGVKKTLLEV